MSDGEFDAAAHLKAMEAVIGLEVRPEWRPGVEANIRTAAGMARLVLDFPLADEVEPAGVFEAGR